MYKKKTITWMRQNGFTFFFNSTLKIYVNITRNTKKNPTFAVYLHYYFKFISLGLILFSFVFDFSLKLGPKSVSEVLCWRYHFIDFNMSVTPRKAFFCSALLLMLLRKRLVNTIHLFFMEPRESIISFITTCLNNTLWEYSPRFFYFVPHQNMPNITKHKFV